MQKFFTDCGGIQALSVLLLFCAKIVFFTAGVLSETLKYLVVSVDRQRLAGAFLASIECLTYAREQLPNLLAAGLQWA
jgi:hypothetical protein